MKKALEGFIFTLVIFGITIFPVYGEPTEIVLLSNSIDYSLAQDFVDFLTTKGFEVTRVEAGTFDAYKNSQFIVILGGPDAPEGVGSIVQQHLTTQEQERLRISGSREMYVKSYPGQSVFLIAGSDRTQTKEAHNEKRGALFDQIDAAVYPPLTLPSPLPTGSKTYYSGEYSGRIYYGGYERADGYTTVRLQSTSNPDHPLVYVTFNNTELPVKFRLAGEIYEVLYYDDEKIIIRR